MHDDYPSANVTGVRGHRDELQYDAYFPGSTYGWVDAVLCTDYECAKHPKLRNRLELGPDVDVNSLNLGVRF